MDGRGLPATLLPHDERCLAREGGVYDFAVSIVLDEVRNLLRQRRLAGSRKSEQPKDLRRGRIDEPLPDGNQGLLLLRRQVISRRHP
jgi:hypothetical protein